MKILTWHIHGNYLYYLSQSPHDFFLPVLPGRPPGYTGRSGSFPWGDNVHEVPADRVRHLPVDCVLYQSRRNWESDQYEILSDSQLRGPRVYLEHDPPRQSPTDTRHPLDDPGVLLVHVTHFNDLMWDSGPVETRVIEHGVVVPSGVRYTGEIERGLVVVNNLVSRGRRLGYDLYSRTRQRVPLDLVGMNADIAFGIGEIQPDRLAAFVARYRFLWNPIRYTSLGLAVCEAMMLGVPIVGLATTEMSTVIENGVSGYIDTDVERLIERMQGLLRDPDLARRLGEGARRTAMERFSIERFGRDWDRTFTEVAGASGAHARTLHADPA
ncbi:MAG: glycosyltransferase [Candidatus Eisenbacteria bacterium]